MTKIELLENYKVVSFDRVWNNSMGFYVDSATILDDDGCGFSNIGVGIDFWDGVRPDSVFNNTAKNLFNEYLAGIRKRQEIESRVAAMIVFCGIYPQPIAERVYEYVESFRGTYHYSAIRKLMTSNLRSKFRISLRDQILTWLRTKPEKRKYKSPLSSKQWEYI